MLKAATLFVGDVIALMLFALSGLVTISGFELMLRLRETTLEFPMTVSVGITEVCVGILMLVISLSYLKRTEKK